MLEKIVKIDVGSGLMEICVPATKEIMHEVLNIPEWNNLSSQEQSKIIKDKNEKAQEDTPTWRRSRFEEQFRLFSSINRKYLIEQQTTFSLYKEIIDDNAENTRIYSNQSAKKILNEDMFILYRNFIEHSNQEYEENLSHVFYIIMLSMFLDSENSDNTDETFENFTHENTSEVEKVILGEKSFVINGDIIGNLKNTYISNQYYCFLPSKFSTLQNIKKMSELTRNQYKIIVETKKGILSKKSTNSSEFKELVERMENSLSVTAFEYEDKTPIETSFLYNILLNKAIYECIIYKQEKGECFDKRINYLNKAFSDLSESIIISYTEDDLIVNEMNHMYKILDDRIQDFNKIYLLGFIMFLKKLGRIISQTSSMSVKNFINEIRLRYETLEPQIFAHQMNSMMRIISAAISAVYSNPFGKTASIEDFLSLLDEENSEDVPIEIYASLYFPKKGKKLVKKDALDEFLIKALEEES